MKYCIYCGKKVKPHDQFCGSCGSKLLKGAGAVKPKQKTSNKNERVNDETWEKLKKLYDDAGTSSVALCVLGFILSVLISLFSSEYSTGETVLGAIILFPFYVPFFYYGRKLTKINRENIEQSRQIAGRMFVYTIVFIVLNFAIGGEVGWLWFFLVYYFYKATRETTKVMGVT